MQSTSSDPEHKVEIEEVIVFSGGMDSATLLWWRLWRGKKVACLSVDYGQRHGKELEYADNFVEVCREKFKVDIPHKIVNLSELGSTILHNSSQTDPSIPVPHGHYEAESMRATVVPNRNMIMLSVAAAWAISLKASKLLYGAHSGDHFIYKDCRPEFVQALALAVGLCDEHELKLEAPFITFSKADICVLGQGLGVPYGDTWTCYSGLAEPCGKCGACQERSESFELAGVLDPLLVN